MEWKLTPVEVRVLGALLEKQMSTPEHYPLTLNALVAACNQKTNRHPVMDLEASEVEAALEGLRQRRLAWQVRTPGSRMPKYEHNAGLLAEFSRSELGLLCELLLRGPQTAGELRARSARLVEFHGVPAVEHSLQKLASHEGGPFVVQLPRRAGHKECRYAHRLGDADPTEGDASTAGTPGAALENPEAAERLTRLEQAVAALQGSVAQLQREVLEIKRAFA
jgi:hypothetical protein